MSLYPPPPFTLREAAARRALWRYWGRDPLRGLKDAVMHALLRPLPTEAVSAFGGRLGRRHGAGRPETSATIRAFLARLRPAATPAEVAALEDGLWEHVGRVVAEFVVLDRLWSEGRIEVEGAARIEAARASGRPLMFAGLHVGNWEAMHAGITGLGVELAGIYQLLPSRFEMAMANRARRRTPIRLLDPVPASALEARRLLARRESAVLMYVDEYVRRRVQAPSLGRAPRAVGNIHRLVRLAALTGAAVLPVHALRVGRAARFRLVVGPALDLRRAPRDVAALAADQAVLDAAAEAVVRAHPEQWLMATSFRWDR
ncbi:lysophospholipid acyltransferase family protein [Falsiroseomonas sp.]|uniref:lysophospholipid acyltransferase family protein n=1 Tax=Falsiroseomonas sp. TaxID=2870721 RepID=UPI003564BAAD